MKKDFPEKMKKRLLEQRKEILGRLNNQSDEMKSLVGTDESGDDADIASVAVERALLDSLNEQDSLTLQQIERALARIEQGKYGVCIKCGKDIPEGRLEALPYAGLCIQCKTVDERRG